MKKTIKFLIFALAVLLIGCKNDNDFKFVEKGTIINLDTIKELNINRGILTLKSFRLKEYNLYSWCPLIYNDTFPDWIKDKGKPDFSFNEYKFQPAISDVDIPYLIYKKQNEDCFYVIKNADTLKFKIAGN